MVPAGLVVAAAGVGSGAGGVLGCAGVCCCCSWCAEGVGWEVEDEGVAANSGLDCCASFSEMELPAGSGGAPCFGDLVS